MASKKGEYTYEYPRPAFTVDVAVVTSTSPPKLLLIQRKHDPYAGFWALPGGFVDEMEPLDVAAARELQEETSIDPSLVATMRQVGTFGDPGRDPRGWTVTTAYGVIVPSTEMGVQAADDAAEAHWFEVSALPKMAFDHKLVVKTALEELAKEAVAGDGDGALRAALTEAAEKLKASWKE